VAAGWPATIGAQHAARASPDPHGHEELDTTGIVHGVSFFPKVVRYARSRERDHEPTATTAELLVSHHRDVRAETSALLIAGRVLDSYAPTVGHVAALRELVAGVPDVAVIVAGDETYDGAPSQPEESLYSRVVIGVVIAEVTADDELHGPLALDQLRAGLAAIATRGEQLWRAVADQIGAGSMAQFDAAQRRAALPESLRAAHVGVGFDGPDLATQPDLVHLVAAGPLSRAVLAFGIAGTIPDEDSEDSEDGEDSEDEDSESRWVRGQRSNQDPTSRGVLGEALASADILGIGTFALDLEALASRLAAASTDQGLFLIARYD
jgi:hypothetical protein